METVLGSETFTENCAQPNLIFSLVYQIQWAYIL